MRLIYPVTYVTILNYDLLSSPTDEEIGPVQEEGEGDCLKVANRHARAIVWGGEVHNLGLGLASTAAAAVYRC